MADMKAFSLASILTDDAGQKSVRDTERGTVITMVASTSAQDRDGEVIAVGGWEWGDPLPKLLWGHDSHSADSVIGKLTRIWRDGERLMIEAELADKVPGAVTAALVAGLLRHGTLDQGSVGFIPKRWRDPDGKVYTADNPGNWWGSMPGRVYEAVELIEFSIVPIPSQRESMLVGVRALGLEDTGPTVPARAEPVRPQAEEAEGTDSPDPVRELPKKGFIRIVSAGSDRETQVLLPDGTDLIKTLHVKSIAYSLEPNSIGIATLEIEAAMDVQAEMYTRQDSTLERMAKNALPDPADEWLMHGILKSNSGEGIPGAHSSREVSDEGNHAWDGVVAALRSAERVEG